MFDVTRLHTRLRGNNVPMPDSLIKTILRMAIPGLIQRKLLGVIPKELGSYLLEGALPLLRCARCACCCAAGSALATALAPDHWRQWGLAARAGLATP